MRIAFVAVSVELGFGAGDGSGVELGGRESSVGSGQSEVVAGRSVGVNMGYVDAGDGYS